MDNILFEVVRCPCIPNPSTRKAILAKSKILLSGGSFYRFSIDGCVGTTELVEYLLEKFGLSEGAILDAIDSMSEVADNEMVVKIKDVWGVSEIIDDKETIAFTGFAITEEELEKKTKLFLSGVQRLKECLDVAISSAGRGMVGTSVWKI